MGKIGDLWVRLGLKSDDYKKGMKDATSTPKWLLEEAAQHVLELNKYVPEWEKKFIN